MPIERVWNEPIDDETQADRQTASLAGLVVALALIVAGLFLVQRLHTESVIEDCLLSGRTNCAQLVSLPL
jgi:hypothetical protein